MQRVAGTAMNTIDPQWLSLVAVVTTFVAGFTATIMAFFRDSSTREASIRRDLLQENKELRSELGDVMRRLTELERTHHGKDAEIARLNARVIELELEVTALMAKDGE